MTAHPHAENMRLYAEDAAETDKPWERWEWRHSPISSVSPDGRWKSCNYDFFWSPLNEYRRKPRTLRIGDKQVAMPTLMLTGKRNLDGDNERWNLLLEFGCYDEMAAFLAALTAQGVSNGN